MTYQPSRRSAPRSPRPTTPRRHGTVLAIGTISLLSFPQDQVSRHGCASPGWRRNSSRFRRGGSKLSHHHRRSYRWLRVMAKIAANVGPLPRSRPVASVPSACEAPSENVEQKKEMLAATASIPDGSEDLDPRPLAAVPNDKVVAQ